MATIYPSESLYHHFIGDRALPEIELDMTHIEAVILKEVWKRLGRGGLKEIEEIVAEEIFQQMGVGLKRIFR